MNSYPTKFKSGIRMFSHKEYHAEVRNLIISQEPAGEYYASILVVEAESHAQQMPEVEEATVGIDVVLTSFATLSDDTMTLCRTGKIVNLNKNIRYSYERGAMSVL